MKKFIVKILVLAAVAAFGSGIAWIVVNNRKNKEVAQSPEFALDEFYYSICSGDWEAAIGRCDTTEVMEEYLDSFRTVWGNELAKDSSALKIASRILADAEIIVSKNEKKGKDRCILHFSINAGSVPVKEKKAWMRREDGIWKISGIAETEAD